MENDPLNLVLEENPSNARLILVGKVLSDKPVCKQGVIRILNTVWRTKKTFSISDWGNNTYGIEFDSAEDAAKILGMSPLFVL